MSNSSAYFWFDSHVHLYNDFDLDLAFDSAWQNLQSQKTNEGHHYLALFLTQSAKELPLKNTQDKCKNWCFEFHPHFAIASRKQTPADKLYLLYGQQLVSTEGLEALVVANPNTRLFDPKSIHDIINENEQGITILPWGFGKWLGKRGRIVRALCADAQLNTRFYLGDIPAKTALVGGVDIFHLQTAPSTIRGTDPLPLPAEEKRIGLFGSCIELPQHNLDDAHSSQQLIEAFMTALKTTKSCGLRSFGRHQTILSILSSQLRLRL